MIMEKTWKIDMIKLIRPYIISGFFVETAPDGGKLPQRGIDPVKVLENGKLVKLGRKR